MLYLLNIISQYLFRALSNNLENAIMEDDCDEQLEILDKLKDILRNNDINHLQSLLPMLLKLMKSNLKEVSCFHKIFQKK